MIDFTKDPAAEEPSDLDKLTDALIMTRTSREFNRKRAEELDDRLHRIRAILDEAIDERVSNYPSELDWAAVRAERDGLKNKVVRLEKQLEKLEHQVTEYDRDRHTERDQADRLKSKVAEQAAELSHRANTIKVLESRYETLLATLDETVEGRDARDRLLAAATTRVRAACEILGATAVCRAREHTITRDGAALADAIGNALRALEG